jgi:hypothetical protein
MSKSAFGGGLKQARANIGGGSGLVGVPLPEPEKLSKATLSRIREVLKKEEADPAPSRNATATFARS